MNFYEEFIFTCVKVGWAILRTKEIMILLDLLILFIINTYFILNKTTFPLQNDLSSR